MVDLRGIHWAVFYIYGHPDYRQDLLTEAYDKIDLDENGDIEFDEFSTGMHTLNVSLTEDEVKEVFNLMDSDSSNFVDRTEFIMFLTQRFESNELRRFQDAILKKVRHHQLHSDAGIPRSTWPSKLRFFLRFHSVDHFVVYTVLYFISLIFAISSVEDNVITSLAMKVHLSMPSPQLN